MTRAPIVARTSSADETRALAGALAGVLRPGDLILLVGDLGTGKTTFSQGLARGLGVTEAVTSPTFTLVRAYRCDGAAGRPGIGTLLHADLYRLDRIREIVELGIGEMVEDDSVAVIEWGDMAGSLFGPETLTVRLGAEGDEERMVTVEPSGRWWERADELAERLRPWKA
ncbi:MAG TPA: tRNA (adenosine(37)-N6)-threonylcarbamoyltransferase complex ATPase subunit type 1 TsaE [Acidimicrobiales bacterium]|nr:tRNA (adenosine(37)-N6)-threonylcarbamoyltransferase complex ATPase subunit type 1 TsaE [Acidimicrobiales bacterium]